MYSVSRINALLLSTSARYGGGRTRFQAVLFLLSNVYCCGDPEKECRRNLSNFKNRLAEGLLPVGHPHIKPHSLLFKEERMGFCHVAPYRTPNGHARYLRKITIYCLLTVFVDYHCISTSLTVSIWSIRYASLLFKYKYIMWNLKKKNFGNNFNSILAKTRVQLLEKILWRSRYGKSRYVKSWFHNKVHFLIHVAKNTRALVRKVSLSLVYLSFLATI